MSSARRRGFAVQDLSERLALRLRSGPRADYADLLDGVYREYMDTLGERKPRWGDKSSSYTISHLERI